MKYLVTGGAGFVGSHLVRLLTERGHNVVVLDIQRGHDVTDFQTLAKRLGGCDGIFHLAAVVGFKRVMADPFLTVDTELRGMRAVLAAVQLYGLPLVYTSSSAVYGRGPETPPPLHGGVKEGDECILGATTTASWGYAYAKAAAECLALNLAREQGLPIRVIRLFNVAGPGQSGGAGFVLPRFCQQAMLGAPLTVYTPGTQTRTFGHVDDVVRGIADLMHCAAADGQVVNIGGRHTVSMLELARIVREMAASQSPIELVPQPYGNGYDNVVDRKPDLSKAKRLIGYEPTKTLEDMVQDVLLENARKVAA